MLDLAELKGKAFSDSSIEEMEREVISQLSERGLNTFEANFGRKSENSEELQSIHSSIDFWQEKLEDRKMRARTNRARNEDKNDEKLQLIASRRCKKTKLEELTKKLESMEKSRKIEFHQVRKQAQKASIDFFRVKAQQVMCLFKQEQMFTVGEFYRLRQSDNDKAKRLKRLNKIIQ